MQKFKPYLNQKYDQIKASCLQSNRLFTDSKFPPNNQSLGKFKQPENVSWKRPSEIVDDPQFIVNRIEPNDIDQGALGDCWVLSAVAVVASVPEYANIVIPNEQSFSGPDYAGVFYFRFWRFGEWVEVVVDDLLPVDDSGNLIYCHNNADKNEMFGPLLEKAYAKVNSCYEFLDGGDDVDAMTDMTGGVHERFKINKKEPDFNKNQLWEAIFKAFNMKSLCGASIDVNENGKIEDVKPNGLVYGHAYSILTCYQLIANNGATYDELRTSLAEDTGKKSVKLLKLRNPWGQNKSWSGKWCKGSDKWNKVNEDLKSQLNLDQSDGQFFISFEDFVQNFDCIDFVHINMNAFSSTLNGDLNVTYKWITKIWNGEWIPGQTAGGCGNDDERDFWKNPQFCVSLSLLNNQDNLVSVIVSLMQTETVKIRSESNGSYENSIVPINFVIYKVKDSALSKFGTNKKFLSKELTEAFSKSTYMSQREITNRVDLAPGNYVIIPSTFDKDVGIKFLLRAYIEGEAEKINLQTYALSKTKNQQQPVAPVVPEVAEQQPENAEDEFYYDNNETYEQYDTAPDTTNIRSDDYYDEEVNEEMAGEEEEAAANEEGQKTRYNISANNLLDQSGKVVSRACLLM